MTQTQKSLLTGVALLGITGGLGAYALLGVKKVEEEKTAAKEKSDKAFDGFDKAKVKELEIRAKGDDTKLARDGAVWKIVAPIQAEADTDMVNGVLAKLEDAKRKATVDEKPADLAPFGLKTPKTIIVASLEGGSKFELDLGDDNAFDSSIYFKRGDATAVNVAEAALKTPLEKSLFDLRDKKLIHFEDTDLHSLEVKAKSLAYSLDRAGDGKWTLTTPISEKADGSAADRLTSTLRNARASRFATELATGAELAKYGLDKPQVTVTLVVGADNAKKTIALGEADEGGAKHSFAQLNGTGPVLEVESTVAKDFDKKIFDLRDKSVATFDKEAVKRVVIENGSETLEFTREKPPPADGGFAEEQFALVKPAGAGAVKKWKCSGALYSLGNLHAAEFADEKPSAKNLARYGLEKPARTYSVFGADGKVLVRVKIGGIEGTKYYVQLEGRARVDLVEKTPIDDLPKTLDDLAEKPTPASNAAPTKPSKG